MVVIHAIIEKRKVHSYGYHMVIDFVLTNRFPVKGVIRFIRMP